MERSKAVVKASPDMVVALPDANRNGGQALVRLADEKGILTAGNGYSWPRTEDLAATAEQAGHEADRRDRHLDRTTCSYVRDTLTPAGQRRGGDRRPRATIPHHPHRAAAARNAKTAPDRQPRGCGKPTAPSEPHRFRRRAVAQGGSGMRLPTAASVGLDAGHSLLARSDADDTESGFTMALEAAAGDWRLASDARCNGRRRRHAASAGTVSIGSAVITA